MDCYKIEIKAEDYPGKHIRAVPLSTGDVLYIKDKSPVKVGDIYNDDKRFVISEIYHTPRKWFEFWKKKEQVGYKVSVREDAL